MKSLLVIGWMCLQCGAWLGRSLFPDEHCPCSPEPMRGRLRVVDPPAPRLDRGVAA